MVQITFIEPKSELPSPLGQLPWTKSLPMMGSVILGTILDKNGYNVKIYKEYLKEPDYSKLQSDYLCIYSMTNTFPRAVKIAYEFRKNNPNSKIIIGGPHVNFVPEDALNLKYNNDYLIDHVVTSEADNIIVDIIKGKYKKRLIHGAPNLNLDELPRINLSLLQGLSNKFDWFPMSTSRGCPFSCKFCSVTKMFGTKFRFRSPDVVVNDIISAQEKYNFNGIFFYDDNFFANPNRGNELLKKMAEKNIKKSFFTQTRIDVAKHDDILRNLGKVSDNVTLFLGFESINDKTLQLYNKRQTFDEIKSAIKKIKSYNYKIMGAFVLGSDDDDKFAAKRTADFCDDMDIDYPQFTVLTPLPGTDLYADLESQNRIFNRDWSMYDVAHVVYKPLKMSASELQASFVDAYRSVYSYTNKRLLRHFFGDVRNIKYLFDFKWLKMRNVLNNIIDEKLDYIKYLEKQNL